MGWSGPPRELQEGERFSTLCTRQVPWGYCSYRRTTFTGVSWCLGVSGQALGRTVCVVCGMDRHEPVGRSGPQCMYHRRLTICTVNMFNSQKADIIAGNLRIDLSQEFQNLST